MKRGDNGFSVVELILSIVVGGLFLLSLTQITNNYVILGGKSRNVVLLNSYAEGKLETLRNIGFNGLTNGTTNVSSELPSQLSTPKSASLVITTPSTNLKKADLSITYSDRGVNRTSNYTAYIGEISDLQ
jgi:hypothetical protein